MNEDEAKLKISNIINEIDPRDRHHCPTDRDMVYDIIYKTNWKDIHHMDKHTFLREICAIFVDPHSEFIPGYIYNLIMKLFLQFSDILDIPVSVHFYCIEDDPLLLIWTHITDKLKELNISHRCKTYKKYYNKKHAQFINIDQLPTLRFEFGKIHYHYYKLYKGLITYDNVMKWIYENIGINSTDENDENDNDDDFGFSVII